MIQESRVFFSPTRYVVVHEMLRSVFFLAHLNPNITGTLNLSERVKLVEYIFYKHIYRSILTSPKTITF